MKKIHLFMCILATLSIAGCQERFAPENGSNGDANTSYMAVNLKSPIVGTRAANGYEDGSTIENDVESVRFYFFTANGAIANVKLLGNSYVNYYDWTPGEGDQKDDKDGDDIESILAATIVISTKDGDKLPQSIAAVLNPTGLDNTSKSLKDLKAIVNDYAASGLTSQGTFVMFNSVYGDNGSEICAVPIEAKHLQKTADKAKANPVTIYVERSVAKVRVALGTNVANAATDKLELKNKKDSNEPLLVGGEKVYLKLNGWSLTAETDEGRLVKCIDPSWTSNWWNGSHRSFWAINSEKSKNKYYSYNEIGTAIGTEELYTNENALDYDADAPIKRTKVILKGQLCKADGTAFTIVRHLGAHFADDENFTELKANILSQLTANGYNYYYADGDGRTQIDKADIQIVVAEQKTNEDSKNNCYVYAQLTDDAAKKTWYASSDKEDTDIVTAETINTTLKDKKVIDWALVWKDGMTYYYYEIIHNGTGENATKGVVRNHIYATTVTSIAGLGTPVYDPGKVIYPEKPEDNDHYIAAEINILSWRVVNSSYDLEW